MRIVLDLQGCQSVSRLRGIGRYSLALARSIVRNAGDHEVWIVLNDLFPESIESVRAAFHGALPNERILTYSLPRFSFYQGANDWRNRAAAFIREHAIAELKPDLVHISSLFEGYVDQSVTSVKALDTDALVAVTLYDLIPFLSPKTYLLDAGSAAHYYGKIEALKRADLLLAISAYCGEEAVRELDVSPERIVNISSAVSDGFVRLAPTDSQRQSLCKRYGIERPFVMTTGIVEPRKNLDGLIVAYARLPVELRRQYQLFMVCQAKEPARSKLLRLAKANGLERDEVVLSGYVEEDDLIALYQTCELFVFPSLHEGFGLPALEAMACGAAVIGSGTTSIPEVIGRDDALFDPLDTVQMARMIERGLTDTAYIESLRAHAATQVKQFSWDVTGRRAIHAFERAFAERQAAGRAGELATSHWRGDTSLGRYTSLIDALTGIDLPSVKRDYIACAGAIAANQRAGRGRQLFVDVSVLCEVDARSGIQRVTRAIVHQLLDSPPSGYEVRPVRLDRGVMAYRYANKFNQGGPNDDSTDDWVESQAGDVFLGLDLVADCIPLAKAWFDSQRRRGITLYFVVYDLLPVLHPMWFPKGISTVFPPWLSSLSSMADGLICISRAVAHDVVEWLDASGGLRSRPLKIGHFHLGADIESSQPSSGFPDDAPAVLAALRGQTTFVMVGTVEPRKGYHQALAAFEALWAANVCVNLVIVGKEGWGVDDLVPALSRHAADNKQFFWLRGISDEYLEEIYASADCLLAASLGEGFGLPLIEAAQKRLPIVARDIPVFREVAGDHAFYFAGNSPDSLADAIKNWMVLHASGQQTPSAAMPWMTWKRSAEELCSVAFEDRWDASWSGASEARQAEPGVIR